MIFETSRSRRSAFRTGTTLIELSVIIAIVSVIFSTLAVSMHRMYRTDTQVRDELAVTENLTRLSNQFRRDAHAAASVEKQMTQGFEAQVDKLLMRLPTGESVEYTQTGDSLQRIRRKGEEVVHRDSFRVARDARVSMAVDEHPSGALASIAIGIETGSSQKLVWATRIEAVIGLDLIHSDGGE